MARNLKYRKDNVSMTKKVRDVGLCIKKTGFKWEPSSILQQSLRAYNAGKEKKKKNR